MKVNKPGKLFEGKNIFESKIYEIIPKPFKVKHVIFGTLENNEFIFNITDISEYPHLTLEIKTFLTEVMKLKINHKINKQGTITWLKIPSYYFNYESK